jgi:hypothetical protein
MMRTLIFTAGAALLGMTLMKRWSAYNASSLRALPLADGPVPGVGSASGPEISLEELRANEEALAPLSAGMPSDMHSDADRARPGFADYARGA